ncbi:MAG: putative GntR family transcriptional regulator [Blastococcus sp.]|jgi:GntR family transcriptional regulator|nr:putative GntR family transcriptional regulator [Blastococcus sp.]
MEVSEISEITHDSRLPYYEQLKQLLMREIARDKLEPGHLMASESEMCQRYGVSRTVVRQAVGELVHEGVLQRIRGKGTFVARPKISEQFMESTVGFFEDMTSHGHSVTSTVLSIDRIEVAGRVRELLGVPPGSHCIEIVRLRAVNDEVVAFTKSYLNRDDAELLEFLRTADLSTASLYRLLEDNFGLHIDAGHRSIEAIAASGMITRLLEVDPGDPLLYIESVARTSDQRVLECFQAWHRADRVKVEMDVVRENRVGGLPSLLSHG